MFANKQKDSLIFFNTLVLLCKDFIMTEKKKLTLTKKLSADVLKKAQSRFDQNRSNLMTFDVKNKNLSAPRSNFDNFSKNEKLTDKELSRRMDALKVSIAEQKKQEELRLEREAKLKKLEEEKKIAEKIALEKSRGIGLKDKEQRGDKKPKLELRSRKNNSFESTSNQNNDAKSDSKSLQSEKQRIDVGTMKRQGRAAVSSAVEERREKLKHLAEKKFSKDKRGKSDKRNINSVVVREVEVGDTITVQDLATQMAMKTVDVVKKLINLGLNVTINQSIDAETAEIVISEFGHKMKKSSNIQLREEFNEIKFHDEKSTLTNRAPVVTVMGHVDHGKTSLLDSFRKTDIAIHEDGGITQRIGAYQVNLSNSKKITFIDTPGHEAFTEMRSRGANTTDIVVLVVAADDGVKQQTVEAINHAKAAGVPIIIAINKIDKTDADPDRVKKELLQYDIAVEDFGGDIPVVEISAKKNIAIDKLEEVILLQAEIMDLKANADRMAEGVVIESRQKVGLGTIASVLIQKGTLRKGDFFVSGRVFGRVRTMTDYKGEIIKEAGPSTPVEVIGFDKSPLPGDDFVVLQDESKAKEIANYRDIRYRESMNAVSAKRIQDSVLSKIQNIEIKDLNIILKADMQGAIEAIRSSVIKLSNEEVKVNVIHSGIGEVTENDVILAKASHAIVIGFNVRANNKVKEKAKQEGVSITFYSIIYDVIDQVRNYIEGMLSPEIIEEELGVAEIRQIFTITKVGKVAGSVVKNGVIKRNAQFRLIRDNTVIYTGNIKSLRRINEDVKEVKDGYECGISLDYQDIHVGDVIECFERKEIAKKLK